VVCFACLLFGVQFSLASSEKPYFVYELAHEIFVELYSLVSFRVHHYTYHSIIGLLIIGLLQDVRELVVTRRVKAGDRGGGARV
jgi:uncharacterized membrane protein